MQTIIIDYRNLVKNLSYSLLSGSIPITFPTEPEEIAHRIAKRVFCIKAEYPDADIIFANDKKPYWRTDYLNDWYSSRGLEPVIYKGNRSNASWPFATDATTIEKLYESMLTNMAEAIEAKVIEATGLEADDIWGLLATTLEGEVIGYSVDSDWRQCITSDGRVKVYDFSTGTMHTEPIDIRVKYLAGDAGDGIKGCTKYKKDGTPAKNGWGKVGAEKHIEANPDSWWEGVDPDELTKNHDVTTLPCPLWDITEAIEALKTETKEYEYNGTHWDRYGITEKVRTHLVTKANREAFINKLRMYLNKENKDV